MMQGAVEFKYKPLSAAILVLLLFVCPLRCGCAAFTSHGGPAVWRRHQSLHVANRRVQVPKKHSASVNNEFSVIENDANVLDQVATVRNLTEEAIIFRGETRGREALLRLGKLCDQRLPFVFGSTQGRRQTQAPGSLISHVPAIVPRHVTEKVLERVKALEREGCFGTNPDSVDGLPSFHLNLVSNGQPLVQSGGGEDRDNLDDFKLCLQDLLGIVEPYIYDKLLPKVNQMMNSSSIRVADIFLRRYGQDMTTIDGKATRNGITAHYDVFSRVTAVIALDDVASQGTNGLFTTQVDEDGKTSNHAALRRFFPLDCGDGVVHTWDVLHGVEVEPGLDRTSLVIWFTTEAELDPNQSLPPAPWLFDQPDLDTNDVGQFVLASSIASSDESCRGDSSWGPKSHSKAMSQSSSTSDDHDSNHSQSTVTHDPFDLYLNSASRENAFALTRLGSLCEDSMLDEAMTSRAKDLVCRLRPDSQLPKALRQREDDAVSTRMSSMDLAKRFWFEGAVRGNPLAQIALGEEILFKASESGEADDLLLAAVLFGLAAQQGQGNEQAIDSLKRVLEFDVAFRVYETQDDVLSSLVVQAAEASCRLPVL
jgi:hypothetical protein